MENDLLKSSQALVSDANKIIKDYDIIQLFSELGKVEIIGSLRLEAMYRRDIDLLVISEDIDKAKAQSVTKKLIDKGTLQTVGLADYQTFPAYEMPLGYYWELIVEYQKQNWKFDIWYLKPDERYTHLVSDSIKKFEVALDTEPSKLATILQIKEAYFDGVKYRNKVKSFDIYNAVLDGSVRSVEDFETYVATQL